MQRTENKKSEQNKNQNKQKTIRNLPALLPSLYFAYGSNLNWEQMSRRCPTARPAGRFVLPGWRLDFRGVADITPQEGAEVAGGLYHIRPGDELALDQYEGFRQSDPEQGLYRKVYRQGRTRTMMFYVMNQGDVAPPSSYYLDTIRQGYDDWGLPAESLEEAVLRAWTEAGREAVPGTGDFLTGNLFGDDPFLDGSDFDVSNREEW